MDKKKYNPSGYTPMEPKDFLQGFFWWLEGIDFKWSDKTPKLVKILFRR